jgi:hypothetical protein
VIYIHSRPLRRERERAIWTSLPSSLCTLSKPLYMNDLQVNDIICYQTLEASGEDLLWLPGLSARDLIAPPMAPLP